MNVGRRNFQRRALEPHPRMTKKSHGRRKSASARSSSVAAPEVRGDAASQAPSLQHSEFLRWRSIYSFLPSALAFVISANTLWNGFAADDAHQVLQNTLIKKLSNIPLAF